MGYIRVYDKKDGDEWYCATYPGPFLKEEELCYEKDINNFTSKLMKLIFKKRSLADQYRFLQDLHLLIDKHFTSNE